MDINLTDFWIQPDSFMPDHGRKFDRAAVEDLKGKVPAYRLFSLLSAGVALRRNNGNLVVRFRVGSSTSSSAFSAAI